MTNRRVSVVIPVYNDGPRAATAVDTMLDQALPAPYVLEVVLIDDGSTDDTFQRLADHQDDRVRVVKLPRNVGRSAARNAGVASALGDVIVFMDCDCVPANGYLAAHIDALGRGAVASVGHVQGDGLGFWSNYQKEASLRRRQLHDAGLVCAGTSQNLAVRRAAFDQVGGFDTGFDRYGFEDRDLLLRIAELGDVVWAEGATVSHRDSLTLSLVAAKLSEAATHSSRRFFERHPTAYEALGYAAIDCRLHARLLVPAKLFSRLAPPAAAAFDFCFGPRWLPYFIAKLIVKATGAAAYLGGTSRRM